MVRPMGLEFALLSVLLSEQFDPPRGTTMTPTPPYFREAGAGPGVVCLHSNASQSGQWRLLLDTLAPRFHVLAADSYGAGRSPGWTGDRPLCLADEAMLLEPVFARAGASLALVGHSYGAAIALIEALARPRRLRALALYEPTLFSVLEQASPPSPDVDGIRAAVAASVAALQAGDAPAAATHFIDYWMGDGAFALMPEARRGPIVASIVGVSAWAQALLGEPTPLEAFRALQLPVLLMVGSGSPASSRGVARHLVAVLPQVEVVEFDGLGHMAPITHPEVVNDTIARFLERTRGAP
jgi:pimeloyl-ACP methyl ester carboxylesterase